MNYEKDCKQLNMSSHRFTMSKSSQNNITAENTETKPLTVKEKVMSYEEKSVGSTAFFKCEACPYMALAEDDIKFHLFTVHPDLAKSNGLADNIQIACPGCTSVFDAEETLRNHLRNHHKMGIKDVKKMIKSLVQIALKNAKLKKKEEATEDSSALSSSTQETVDVKIPQVIEIVPDNTPNNESLPKGVAFISVDELNKMSAPNFEKVDPKEIIQGASINIVYTNEVTAQYVNVSNATATSNTCNVIQVSNVPPDLISSIQPRLNTILDNKLSPPDIPKENAEQANIYPKMNHLKKCSKKSYVNAELRERETQQRLGVPCLVDGCHVRLKDEEKLLYHRKCHQNDMFVCPECSNTCISVEALHTHLWKVHEVDMELPTCDICGYKTFRRHRLYNIHMRCHGKAKAYSCNICSKSFKNTNQLSKHRLIHKKVAIRVQCPTCHLDFNNEHRLKIHITEVHEKVKPFKCCHCDYTATRKQLLELHLRSHTGDKPYSCDQCSYRSGDHNSMRRHKKQHTKESMYKCKYCPYTTIQSNVFASHMISQHPNVTSQDVFRCPYCTFRSVNKEKYVVHLTTHTDKEGIHVLIDMIKSTKSNIPSWTIPSETVKSIDKEDVEPNPNKESSPKPLNEIPIEVYDCDSLSEASIPQDYSKNYNEASSNENQKPDYSNKGLVTDLSKVDNSSVCLISESSNDTLMNRHQYTPQHPLQMPYDNNQPNLHGFLNPAVSLEQTLMQNSSPTLVSSHSASVSNMSNNIMANFPIRLPPVPQLAVRNNITLKPVDKFPLPMTKVIGPIIRPSQILPVPSSSNSPVNALIEPDGIPRKKPKISVKSNLILKGPDQENMFHSQQKMAFKRLEDNERFRLGGPVTFNNLITTQFMPEPALSESPNNIIPYPQESIIGDAASTPVDNGLNDTSQIFTFNQQMTVNSITMLPPPQKIQANDPNYIKIEAPIKQNTQSPSLERMCNANLLNNQAITREYKASPPLEDIHKNMNVIKNELKADTYYNLALNNAASNPTVLDQYLMDNIIGEPYTGHMDLSTVVLPDVTEDQQNDVIEIDDNSDDNKLLPRFDMNFPLESLYLMHNDFHFLDNDIPTNMSNDVTGEINRIVVNDVPTINHKESVDIPLPEGLANDCQNYIQGKKDPMMNTSVRQTTNKINVKNIELMKN